MRPSGPSLLFQDFAPPWWKKTFSHWGPMSGKIPKLFCPQGCRTDGTISSLNVRFQVPEGRWPSVKHSGGFLWLCSQTGSYRKWKPGLSRAREDLSSGTELNEELR